MKSIISMLALFLLAVTAQAQVDQPKEINTAQRFGDYTVHYNVFHSTDIPAPVAEAYKLVRGKDRALLNISFTKTENGQTSLGLPAKVIGKTKNLMQQSQDLTFIEIKEGEATYYLAPFVFNNEELLHFDVQVIEGENKPLAVTFNRTLYTE
ncbi:DUF4426 domain-containing protein [Cellvibrio mixtus]|uniref:DUF4426 domain-containing protein n=1 Tax=Cellvibrio mixtus TaxID=39650 RepID=UPI000587580B|nr:DUF4426 domain-containing protein [Cellvibrio mixtus]